MFNISIKFDKKLHCLFTQSQADVQNQRINYIYIFFTSCPPSENHVKKLIKFDKTDQIRV